MGEKLGLYMEISKQLENATSLLLNLDHGGGKKQRPKMTYNGKAGEFVKGQVDALRTAVERPQAKALPMSKPSSLLPSKKMKSMAIKKEEALPAQVMAIMAIGLERPEPVEVPMEIRLDD